MTRRYFVILGAMRTGSNLLEKTLAALGDTVCYGEPFNPSFIGEPRFDSFWDWDIDRRNRDPLGFLKCLRTEAGHKIPGFRIFDGHDPMVLKCVLSAPDCRRIVLRRDPLDSFISLKIARETGQWMLKDERRRLTLKMTFDGPEFETYREGLQAHYDWMDAELGRTGSDCLRVRYDDLTEPTTLEAIARYIGSNGTVPSTSPILRQNPICLSQKVANYDAMCRWTGQMPQRVVPPEVVGRSDVLVSARAPLAYAPIDGPGFEAAISLMYRFEQRAFDGPSHSYAALMKQAAQGALFPDAESVAEGLSARVPFTIVSHPALRWRYLFEQELFGQGWHRSPVRRRLIADHGGLPSPRELAATSDAADPVIVADAFLGFLRIVEDARAGQGLVDMPRRWQSQTTLLQAYRGILNISHVGRLEDLAATSDYLATEMGVQDLPPKHVTGVVERALGLHLPEEFYRCGAVLEALTGMDAEDVETFGYTS